MQHFDPASPFLRTIVRRRNASTSQSTSGRGEQTLITAPFRLEPNLVPRAYLGGALLPTFRTGVSCQAPEDWIASDVCARGLDVGPSPLAGGEDLRSASARQADQLFGPEHVARWGPVLGILVKLLDPGSRIPIHCHPSRGFAAAHFGSSFGKTEASVVLAAPAGTATTYIGFAAPIEFDEICELVAADDDAALLGLMRTVELSPGDCLFIPAGVPHALASNALVVEIQEPTDFSILLEGPERGTGNKGPEQRLELDLALRAVDRSGWTGADLDELIVRGREIDLSAAVTSLVPPDAAAFFGLQLVRALQEPSLPPQCAILIATEGRATVEWSTDRSELSLERGDAALIPFAAGTTTIRGEAQLIRCIPPSPA